MAITEYGHRITDPHDVAQIVTDVNDGHPLPLESGDHLEQFVYLAAGERCGRLVQHQDAGVLRQGLGYLDELLLADAELPHLAGRIQLDAEHGQQRPSPAYPFPVGNEGALLAPPGQVDVVGHRQGRDQA